MPAPARVPLGASTRNSKWFCDVSPNGVGPTLTGTAVVADDTITLATGHNLANGDPVKFTTVVAPLVAGTTYYTVNSTATSVKVAATPGGTAIDITAAGAVVLAEQPVWIGVFGITEFTPGKVDANLEDDSDYDSGGYKSSTKTAEGWSLEFTVARKVIDGTPTAYNPGQELLRTKSLGTFGVANSITVRYYEMEPGGPRVEAYQGRGAVVWDPQGGAMTALSMAKVTITGQGALAQITHPDAP